MAVVERTDKDGAATLILNRPDKLNALNVEMFVELDAHVKAIAAATDKVGLVIVRGAGRCFSAGHDLSDIAAGEKLPEPFYQSKVIERLAGLPQPVISAVHGHCYTGALELALAGDIVFAAEGARMADTHAKWALTPVWGMSQRLPRRVGTYRAREMMFTCRTIQGPEAASIGLADFCVPDAEFDARLDKLAADILANSWFSHRANKALVTDTDGMTQSQGLAHEIFRGQGRGPDMEARIAGFQNKTVKQA
ncbi:enoyl-CoA hydratase/isomerase family protein [uncultured Phenylobacterium sp.]|uniref:enoyl-CoA hydratase/isomerase family protein n=1 Tax=uncultured Phenylobacterium sp. TaxID=349273 RepID=UPI0025DDDBD9|nr:enoyl-CoA hydratase/isomerase family protein [uncultured Phenylobacterium sp.]